MVIEHKLVDYKYFLDDMQEYEINDMIKYLPFSTKTQYEIARWQVYSSIAPYLKQTERNKSVQELFPLITDEKAASEKAVEPLSNEEIEHMRAMSKRIQAQLFENENNHAM
jgi:hypothetical protein